MNAIQTAFENYCHDKPVDLRKKADGRYLMGSTRTMWREFKVIFEMGQASVLSAVHARKPMGEALQHVAGRAKTMGVGYGD